MTALGLGAGKGNVGVPQQLRRGVAVIRGEGNAGAQGAHELLVGNANGKAQRLGQAIHKGYDLAEIVDIDDGHGKFVARTPRHEVGGAQRRPDAVADLAQHGISGGKVNPNR